ncbi:hypothetical protein [Mycobacterium kyorinense]|nr:hypothetical protein [Mycobacterium kyorinense]
MSGKSASIVEARSFGSTAMPRNQGKRELIFMIPAEDKTEEELAHEAWLAIQRWRAKQEADLANALRNQALQSLNDTDLVTARELLQEAASKATDAKNLLQDASPEEIRDLDDFIRRCSSTAGWLSIRTDDDDAESARYLEGWDYENDAPPPD